MERDFDRKLVSYVERHPALYDPADPGYKDGPRVAAAWGQIAASLEASECVVKSRWKDLRRSFRKAYREFATMAPACSRHPKSCIAFPFFESMLWLAPYIRKKRCSATLKIRKCPVHGFIGEQMTRARQRRDAEEADRKSERRKESLTSETSVQSCSSYFTESSCGVGPGAVRKGVEGRGGSEPRQTTSGDNPNKDQKEHNGERKQEKENSIKASSLHKQCNPALSQDGQKKHECTQTEETLLAKNVERDNGFRPTNAACQGLLAADMNFMLSIISDMQLISYKKRIKFKREVMQLLEKYALSDSN